MHLRQSPVVLGLTFLCALAYLIAGPATQSQPTAPYVTTLKMAFRHGDLWHLLNNLALLLAAGLRCEPDLGSAKTALLAALCLTFGSAAQLHFVDGNFVGISGVVYGFAAYALLSSPSQSARFWSLLGLTVLLTYQARFLSQSLSIYTHILSTLIGGGFAMLGKLFGSATPTLKKMEKSHIGQVVQIIAETDEDDAEEAEEGFFSAGGLEDMFVLMQRGTVLGVTGFTLDQDSDDVAWLSWTYLSQDCIGAGHGSNMMNDMLGRLKDLGVRKVFISSSDYEEHGHCIYENAHRMYKDFGAELELTVPDYHSVGEAKLVFGLGNPEFPEQPPRPETTDKGIRIMGLEQAPEGDGVAGLTWEEIPAEVVDFPKTVQRAEADGARLAVLVLPSDLSAQNETYLLSQKFRISGELKDFYAIGLHQTWWTCSMAKN